MAEIDGGRLVAKVLKQEGVECIFAVSGGHIDPIFQGCKDEGIRVIDTRNEQAAVFAAEGWAWATGKTGVAVATAGPGATNTITGLWNALERGAPIVVFGGRSPLHTFDRGDFQDVDSLSLARVVTKWARSCYETARVAEYASTAFRQALGGRPGPAYLEVPTDVFHRTVEESEVTLPINYRTAARPQGDATLVKEAINLLLGAERPLIIAGSGVWWSQAAGELRKFAELTQIPVGGRYGSLPADHPLSLPNGRIGYNSADVVLVLGTRLNGMQSYGLPPAFKEDSKWIQVDIEATEIGKNRPIDIGIIGDIKAVLEQMIEEARDRCQGREQSLWVSELQALIKERQERREPILNSDMIPVHPARLYKEIRDFLDRDASVVVDGGTSMVMGTHLINTYLPGHTHISHPTGTLGIGQPYAMAAKLAFPDKQVILVTGDGSFGFNAMEFDTMLRHDIPVVCVIVNDEHWGMITHGQRRRGPDRVIGTYLGFRRYDKMVEGLGGYGEAVEKPEDIRPALERAFASGLPACINVRCALDYPALP